MAKIEWGVKRSCYSCGSRFYDLEKPAPACPKCGTLVEIMTSHRARKNKTTSFEPKHIKVIAKEEEIILDDADLLDTDITDVLLEDEDSIPVE